MNSPKHQKNDLTGTSKSKRAFEVMRAAVNAREMPWTDPEDLTDDDRAAAAVRADGLSAQAIALLRLESAPFVASGEVVDQNPQTARRESIAATLESPSQIAVDASIARTDLLVQVQSDVLALAVDAAHSVRAKNSLEKMLAHQLALLHSVAMRTMDNALLQSRDCDRIGLLNATTRMMDVFQRGLLTVQKLRLGNKQTVVVKHVTIQSGAQAVIGNIAPGKRSRTRRGIPRT